MKLQSTTAVFAFALLAVATSTLASPIERMTNNTVTPRSEHIDIQECISEGGTIGCCDHSPHWKTPWDCVGYGNIGAIPDRRPGRCGHHSKYNNGPFCFWSHAPNQPFKPEKLSKSKKHFGRYSPEGAAALDFVDKEGHYRGPNLFKLREAAIDGRYDGNTFDGIHVQTHVHPRLAKRNSTLVNEAVVDDGKLTENAVDASDLIDSPTRTSAGGNCTLTDEDDVDVEECY